MFFVGAFWLETSVRTWGSAFIIRTLILILNILIISSICCISMTCVSRSSEIQLVCHMKDIWWSLLVLILNLLSRWVFVANISLSYYSLSWWAVWMIIFLNLLGYSCSSHVTFFIWIFLNFFLKVLTSS